MIEIPEEYRWVTSDGQTLDIRWMTTPHLAYSVNLVMRNSSIDRRRALLALSTPPNNMSTRVFTNMVKEVKSRMPIEWHQPNIQGKLQDQIIVDPRMPRETIKTLCLMRAMFDTNVFHPRIVPISEVMRQLRESPDVVFLSIEQHRASNPHPDLFKLLAKFTEYRLWRT